MKRYKYTVVMSKYGFGEMEEKVSNLMNQGWKLIGGLYFSANFPYQALAKLENVSEKQQEEERKKAVKLLTANEAMKKLDEMV